jgi:hypothetical protein
MKKGFVSILTAGIILTTTGCYENNNSMARRDYESDYYRPNNYRDYRRDNFRRPIIVSPPAPRYYELKINRPRQPIHRQEYHPLRHQQSRPPQGIYPHQRNNQQHKRR